MGLLKTNFKVENNKKDPDNSVETQSKENKDLTKEEFEQMIVKTGAAGSFMIFRSEKKSDEMGLDEL